MLWRKRFLFLGVISLKKPLTDEERFLQIEKRIYKLKIAEIAFIVILAVVMVGSLMIIVEIEFGCDNPTYQLIAEIISVYTGIILGFVAVVVSLLSMVLSFHNTRQAEQTNLDSTKAFTQLTNTSEDIKRLENDLSDRMISLSSELNKLSNLVEIKEQLSLLASQLQSDVDKQKGSRTRGVEANTVGDFTKSTSTDKFDDLGI